MTNIIDSNTLRKTLHATIHATWLEAEHPDAKGLPDDATNFEQMGGSRIRGGRTSMSDLKEAIDRFVTGYTRCRVFGLIPRVDNTQERGDWENLMKEYLRDQTLLSEATANALIDRVVQNVDTKLQELGLGGHAQRLFGRSDSPGAER